MKKQPTTSPLIVLRILHKNCSAKSVSFCERANLFKIYLGGLCARKRKRNTQDWELTLTEATHLCEEEQNGTETRTSNKDSLSDLLVSVYLLPSLGDGPSNHVPRLYRRGEGVPWQKWYSCRSFRSHNSQQTSAAKIFGSTGGEARHVKEEKIFC